MADLLCSIHLLLFLCFSPLRFVSEKPGMVM